MLFRSTDGFVVSPLEFPGGDIGKLCVVGTLNDLAVAGAVPLWLSAAFILEEGLDLDRLDGIAASMGRTAAGAGVQIVTGDTKVVERGHGDGVYVVTTGVGRLRPEPPPGPTAACEGDAVIVSGSIGDHGAVIAALRMGLDVGAGLRSDCGPVFPLVDALYAAGVRPRFLRDPTRGGLVTVLAELAREARRSVELDESALPVRPEVEGVCAILGLEPLYLACEGRLVAVVAPGDADCALAALRAGPDGAGAAIVGRIVPETTGPVVLRTRFGGARLYDTLAADPLPRIC